MVDETLKNINNKTGSPSFTIRVFMHIFVYIVIWLLMAFYLSYYSKGTIFDEHTFLGNILFNVVLFGVPTIIPYFLEVHERKWRKENGFDIYKKITANMLQQKAVDERVAMEKKAYEKAGVNQSGVDKNDIGYWFDLKEKGAISEDEFNLKKAELLK